MKNQKLIMIGVAVVLVLLLVGTVVTLGSKKQKTSPKTENVLPIKFGNSQQFRCLKSQIASEPIFMVPFLH